MTSDPELTQIRESVLARFHELGFRVRTRLLLEGLTRVVAVMAGLCLLSYLLDRSLRLSQFTRGGLLVIGVGVIGYETWQQMIRPLLLTLKPIELAYALDERMAAQVAAILELPNVEGASPPSFGKRCSGRIGRCPRQTFAGIWMRSGGNPHCGFCSAYCW